MYLTEKLARLVVGLDAARVPQAALAKAKECVQDCIGVTIAGSAEPIREPLLQYIDAVGGKPVATLIGVGRTTSATNAALVNGTFGHVLDYDDTNQIFIGHGSVVVVPAILALAEMQGSSGAEMLAAYLLGTEVQWKLGEALVACGDHYAKGWHSTSTVGAFGATAAAARLLRLTEDQAAHAFGIVASEVGGFQEQFGTYCKPFHAGRANEVGVRAALLARGGFTSARSALEGNVGLLKLIADKYDLSKVDRFGEPWGILETTFGRGINLKAHPVCASALGAVEGMQALVARHGFTAQDVERIECGVRPHSLNILMYHEPKTGLQAKFSAEYWPAITLLRGRLGLDEVRDEVVASSDVQALIRKVHVYPDPSITVSNARVNIKVVLRNGQTYTEAYYPAKGAADNPLTRAELDDKFLECAQWGGLDRDKALRAIELLSDLEHLDDPRTLVQCLVR